ncbi:Ig-like domain-containing protein, partial [Rubrivivax sp. A210]
LARVGPTNLPSPAGHGFPLWYQDATGLVLDLCLPNAADPGGLQGLVCLMETAPPYNFPATFPGESFYFRATTPPMDMPGGKKATLVLGLEATFNGGVAAVNDQVTFTRIRATAGVPEVGTYTVTHPYGTNVIEVTAVGPGNRDLNFSEDIGITTGVFNGALKSRLGPFLVAADPVTGAALPPVTINGAQFLADVDPVNVTGSPFNTNFFRICGKRADGSVIVLGGFGPADPADPLSTGSCAETAIFSLTGRVHDAITSPIGSPLKVDGVTYSRNAAGTHVDVSATAGRALASQPVPLLSAASSTTPPVRMVGPDVLDRFYTHGFTDPTGALPGQVIVINSADTPPSSALATAHDVVTVLSTSYDAVAQTLTVVATSSDKGFGAELPPALILDGYATVTATTGTVAGDPASVTLVASGVTIPPSLIVVQSSTGGLGRVELAPSANDAYAPGVPYAFDDLVTIAGEAVGPQPITVLANDLANALAPIDPATVALMAPGLTPANMGTLVKNLDGTFTFTPNGRVGAASFKYTVNATGVVGSSNVATVNVNVDVPLAGATPLAAADGPVTTLIGTADVGGQTINVLANDIGNGGTLNTASVTIVPGSVVGGTATVQAGGTVKFVGGTAANANAGFDYTVANTNGLLSAVTHVRTPVITSEPVAVAAGTQCTRASRRWRMDGTGMVPNTTVTVYSTGTVPAAPTAANTIATVTADATGAFTVDAVGPTCATRASLRTSTHTNRTNIAVTLR